MRGFFLWFFILHTIDCAQVVQPAHEVTMGILMGQQLLVYMGWKDFGALILRNIPGF